MSTTVQHSTFTLSESKQTKKAHSDAFWKARDTMLQLCIESFPIEQIDDVQGGLQYIIDYHKTIVVDMTDDNIPISIHHRDYTFSKQKFMNDKKFLARLRFELSKIIPNSWISIFPAKNGNFLIKFSAKH
jgi:hypothetical protein